MARTNYCRAPEDVQCEKVCRWIKRQCKQKELAELVGMSEQLISYKLKTGSIKTDELILIFHKLNAEPMEIGKLLTY